MARANSLVMHAAAQGREAAEIGWLRAHVRVGRSYPLLAVRVCRRAAPGGGVLLVVDSDQQAVLDAAAYAIAIARGLDSQHVRIAALDLDVSLVGAEPGLTVDLRVMPHSASTLDQEEVLEVAERVLSEAGAARTWAVGEPRAVRVEVVQDFAPRTAAARAPVAPDAKVVESAATVTSDGEQDELAPATAALTAPVQPQAEVLESAAAAASDGEQEDFALRAAAPSAPVEPEPTAVVSAAGARDGEQNDSAQATSAAPAVASAAAGTSDDEQSEFAPPTVASSAPVEADAEVVAWAAAGTSDGEQEDFALRTAAPSAPVEPEPTAVVSAAAGTCDDEQSEFAPRTVASSAPLEAGPTVVESAAAAASDGGRASQLGVASATEVDSVETAADAHQAQPIVEQPDTLEAAEDAVANQQAEGKEPPRVPPWRNAVLLVAAVIGVALIGLATSQLRGPNVTGPPVAEPVRQAPTVAAQVGAEAPIQVVRATPAVEGVQVSATLAANPPEVAANPPQVAATTPPERVQVTPTAAAAVPPRQTTLLDFAAGQGAGTGDGFAWPNQPQGVAWFGSDGYHLAARKPAQFVGIGVLPGQDLTSVLVTATFHKVGGPPGGGYGLILGDQGPGPRDGANQSGSFVVFEVGDKGEVGVWRRDQDQWRDILGWTPSAAVRAAAGENLLVVRVADGRVSFSVNGADIPAQASAQPISGRVGVFLGGDANEAVLTQLRVVRLDQ